MNAFVKSNPREKIFPKKQRTKKNVQTGDCVIRAIVHATGMDYGTVWNALLDLAKESNFLPNYEENYGQYLESIGWVKRKPKRNFYNKTYEVRHFPSKPRGKYVILTTGHLTAIVNGKHMDSWNCGRSRANSYYEKA
jgi:hypothetical protein